MSESLWGGGELDLDAYLARIKVTGDIRPDLATLRAVHRAHVAAFPFENLEILLGRPILLEIKALQDKMVARRRGGYCYEQNLLFAAALERIGFSFTGIGARVRMGSDKLRPVTHMALKVEADGGHWLCDVGFGGEGLLEPLPFHNGVRVRQGDWTFGIHPEGAEGSQEAGGPPDLRGPARRGFACCAPSTRMAGSTCTLSAPKSDFRSTTS
ncbi:arylamine N-acetyltransferase [Streptomyces stramineus]